MRLLTSILVLLLAGRSADAQTNTQQCLAHMDEWIGQLEALEQSSSNDTARAECIAGRRSKIKGLRELAGQAARRLPELLADQDADAVAAEQSAITIACARAEKIAAEADFCNNTPPQTRKRRTLPAVSAPGRSRFRATRDEQTCLKQSDLARLLLQVMELSPEPQSPARSSPEELARFAIEPLEGWKPDDCVTLDELCVIVARALNLKVESPTTAASYCDALREAALAIDIYFPPRVEGGDAPVLLEPEVRAFLARGYAVPLASSRPNEPE